MVLKTTRLTMQEIRVKNLMSQGFNIASIASNLGIKIDTAKTYVSTVRRKLGLCSIKNWKGFY